MPPEFPPFVKSVHFTSDGTSIQTVSVDGQFQSWDTSTRKPRGPAIKCCEPGDSVRDINPLGTLALISGPTGTRLVSLPDCKAISMLQAEPSLVGGFTDDGSTVFATGPDFKSPARRWNATDGSLLTKPVDRSLRYARSWHDHGHWLMVDLALETSRRETDDSSPPLHLSQASLHPSGLYYVTIEDGTTAEIHFWSVTGKSIGPPIPHGQLHRVEFNPDGQSLITTSDTGTVRQWTLPSMATESIEQLTSEFKRLP